MEEKIIEHLKEKYKPKLVVLAGSQANGNPDAKSDWDLFVFSEEKSAGCFYEFEGQTLDITVLAWPKSDDYFFSIPYGPMFPVRVMLDETGGECDKILQRTKEAYDKGPLVLYRDACMERFQKLTRWLGKMERYHDNKIAEFYYAGFTIEFLLRCWYELQNRWPLPPAKAILNIQGADPAYHVWLEQFVGSIGEVRVGVTRKMVGRLEDLIAK